MEILGTVSDECLNLISISLSRIIDDTNKTTNELCHSYTLNSRSTLILHVESMTNLIHKNNDLMQDGNILRVTNFMGPNIVTNNNYKDNIRNYLTVISNYTSHSNSINANDIVTITYHNNMYTINKLESPSFYCAMVNTSKIALYNMKQNINTKVNYDIMSTSIIVAVILFIVILIVILLLSSILHFNE